MAPVAQFFGPWVPQLWDGSTGIIWDGFRVLGHHMAPPQDTKIIQDIPSYQQQILQIDGSRWFQSGCNLHRSRGFIQNQAAQALGWRRATHLHRKGGVLWNAVHSPTNVIFLAILLLLQVLSFGPAVLITLTSGCQAHVVVKKNTCRLRDSMSVGELLILLTKWYQLVPPSNSKWFQVHPILPTNSNWFSLQHHILQQPSHGPG